MAEKEPENKKGGIFGGKSSMKEDLRDISGDKKVTFADTWLGDLLGADGSFGVQGPGLRRSWFGARRDGPGSKANKPNLEDVRRMEEMDQVAGTGGPKRERIARALEELDQVAGTGGPRRGRYSEMDQVAGTGGPRRGNFTEEEAGLDIDMRAGYKASLIGRRGTDLENKTSIADLSEMSGSGMQGLPAKPKQDIDMRAGYKASLSGNTGLDAVDLPEPTISATSPKQPSSSRLMKNSELDAGSAEKDEGVKAGRTVGLMSRPSSEKMPLVSAENQTAFFGDLLQVLGSKSGVYKDINELLSSGGKFKKRENLTKIIKEVQAAPKSEAKSRALDKLYQMRDALK